MADKKVSELSALDTATVADEMYIVNGGASYKVAISTLKTLLDSVLTFIPTSQKAAASGVASLDASGKIPTAQIPSVALTDTFVVANEAAMLALTAQTGDVAIRTDENKSYILQGTDASVLADWKELLTPTDQVQSVFGRSGVVVATASDYDASQVDNDSSVPGDFVDDALNALNVETITGMIEVADDKTYILDQSARHAYSVENLYIKASSGTCTAKLVIESTDITGITGVSVSSTEASATATAANSVAVGETLKLVISSNSSAEDVAFSIETNRG